MSRYIPPDDPGPTACSSRRSTGASGPSRSTSSAEGRAVFERLVASADAVYSNLRGDQPERLGLTYQALGGLNPAIVCVALTGYGRTGRAPACRATTR